MHEEFENLSKKLDLKMAYKKERWPGELTFRVICNNQEFFYLSTWLIS